MPPDISFDELWRAATAWAKEQESMALTGGRPLSVKEQTLAKIVKVDRPELVKIYSVPTVPVPKDGIVFKFLESKGLTRRDWSGLTVGHCIILREGAEKTRYFAHELRHVGQYETFGSVENFMFCYLKELDTYEYPLGPLENDATLAEKEFDRWIAE